MPKPTYRQKFLRLMQIEGETNEIDFLQRCSSDSIVPGICMNEGCNATYQYEPDQDRGWCEECNTGTVKSALILEYLI